MLNVVIIRCPTCGGSVSATSKLCEYCGNTVALEYSDNIFSATNTKLKNYISSFEEVDENFIEKYQTLALSYLHLRQYAKSLLILDDAIRDNPQNPDFYFLKAIALLNGKKPFNVHITKIKESLNNLETAVLLDDKAIYRFAIAYIKYDFYKRKFLRINPTYEEEVALAFSKGFDSKHLQHLQGLVAHQIPEEIYKKKGEFYYE